VNCSAARFSWLRADSAVRCLILLTLAAGCGRASTGESNAQAAAPSPAPPRPQPAAGALSSGAAAKPLPPSQTAFYADSFQKIPTVPAMTALGRALFFAPELSASGKLSCAGCHDPKRAFGPPPTLPLDHKGDRGLADFRAVPSLRYLQTVPRFQEHYFEPDGDGSDQGPAGGFTWDGRAQTTHDQARLPLFSPLEMANVSEADLVARLRGSRLAAQLRDTYGDKVLDTTASGIKAVLKALEVFQQSPNEFYPYDSKFDAVLRQKAAFTPKEAHGLALFNSPNKGNCASCHPSRPKEGGFPAFTDYGYVALGVPRNRAIAANADAAFFDLGLCGPLRTDLKQHSEYCGFFRAPSLRNVATRRRFFHNGAIKSLRDAVRFYVERDTHPERWYGKDASGHVTAYDDLPPRYQKQLNREAPFGTQEKPALTDAEIDDVVAFLGTLSDGYRVGAK
jgi:cytochrome c peroxidase